MNKLMAIVLAPIKLVAILLSVLLIVKCGLAGPPLFFEIDSDQTVSVTINQIEANGLSSSGKMWLADWKKGDGQEERFYAFATRMLLLMASLANFGVLCKLLYGKPPVMVQKKSFS